MEKTISSYKWVIFSLLSLSHLLMAMFFYIWGPLAPILKDVLVINNSQLGLVISTMYLAMVLVSIPSGILTDKYGARGMLIIAASLVGGALLILYAAPIYSGLFVVSILGGTGYGMINQVTTKGLMYWFEPDRRATIMGVKQTGVTIGGGLIAVYIPFVSLLFGWQKGVLLIAVVIFATAAASFLFYKEKPEDLTKGSSGNPRAFTLNSLRSIILRPSLVILTLIFTFLAASQACLVAFLVVYARETFHLTKILSGSLLTVAMVAGTVSRILFGVVSDRIFGSDRLTPLAILAFIGLLNCTALVMINGNVPIWFLFLISAFLGAALIGWNSLAITLVAEVSGNEMVGSVMGFLFTIAWGGMVIGPSLFGALVDWKGYAAAWCMVAVFCGISLTGYVFILAHHRKKAFV